MKNFNGRVAALAALPFGLALAAALAAYSTVRDRLPATMATHFQGSGRADGFTSRGSFLAVCVVLPLALGALFAVSGLLKGQTRFAVVLGYATGGLIGSVLVSTLVVNAGTPENTAVRLPLWHLGTAMGIAAVMAGLGWLTVRDMPEPSAGTQLPAGSRLPARADLSRRISADLERGRTTGWVHATSSRVLTVVALALLAAGSVLLVFGNRTEAGIALLVAGLLSLCFAHLDVSVGHRGLVVSPAVLPWPRIRVPLESIRGAESRETRALRDFGGYGYRLRSGASGVILHSGETLFVQRSTGRDFAVTVDDATTAAALLNSLVDSRKAAR